MERRVGRELRLEPHDMPRSPKRKSRRHVLRGGWKTKRVQ